MLDEVSGGIARATNVALASNGQTVDIGVLILDSTRISIVSVNPADGATSRPTNGTVITVTFSEPAESSTVNSSTVQLQLGNSAVGTTLSLSSDGRVATLTPVNRLAEGSTYKIYVNQVEDRAGLRPREVERVRQVGADRDVPRPPDDIGDEHHHAEANLYR